MNIRPISDLRNRYADVERDVIEGGPVFLTKNGYGSMVVMSVEQFEHINAVSSSLSSMRPTGKLRRRLCATRMKKCSVPFGKGFAMDEKPRRYRLEYLPLFWDDLNEAVSYIADVLKAPEAAERLIDARSGHLGSFPEIPRKGTTYKTAKPRPLPYYWFEVGNYMVFYVVLDDVMEVRRFLYGARDLTKMLL